MKLATPLETPCREWQGRRDPKGYGVITRVRRKWYVHRWVWTLMYGPIPEGMCVLHRCDNPPCFRLDHLWLGTHAENMADMKAKGRSAVFTAENLAAVRAGVARSQAGRRWQHRRHH